MSVEGIILHHGEAGGVTLHQTRIDYLVIDFEIRIYIKQLCRACSSRCGRRDGG